MQPIIAKGTRDDLSWIQIDNGCGVFRIRDRAFVRIFIINAVQHPDISKCLLNRVGSHRKTIEGDGVGSGSIFHQEEGSQAIRMIE
jgi:hypothetical protein